MDKFTIAFLGTDGSGKSTIIREITSIIEEKTGMIVRYEHMRPNYLPSLAVALGKRSKDEDYANGPVNNPHASKPSGLIGSFLRLGYYLIDYTYGYFRKIYPSRNIVWIFDRYYYDLLFDQKRTRISLPKCMISMFGKIVPKPNVIICLGGEPCLIYSRKPETSLEEVACQMEALKSFCATESKAFWIDTTTDVKESVCAVLKAIGIK